MHKNDFIICSQSFAIISVFKNKQLQLNHQSKGVIIFLEIYFRLLSIDSADELYEIGVTDLRLCFPKMYNN